MAEFLSRREKLKEALRLYLIVCDNDLNGAENRGGTSAGILRQIPLFDVSMATLASVVVENVWDIAEIPKLSTEDVSQRYIKSTSRTNFPLAPEKAWRVLALAIEGKIDLDDQSRCFERIRS